MISKGAEKITAWLIKNNEIEEADKELYQYALYSFFLTLSPMLLAIVLGSVMGCLKQSICIILPFMFIRKFSGGYHAKKSRICFICSSLLLFLCIEISNYAKCNRDLFLITIIAAIILMVFSPIDHENRRLELKEKQKYKKIASILVLLFVCLSIGCFTAHKEKEAVCFSIGIILSAGLQLPCILNFIKR